MSQQNFIDTILNGSTNKKTGGTLVLSRSVYSNFSVHCNVVRENAGLFALTRVGSRRVSQISAGFMIFFSVFGIPCLFA